MKLTDSFRRAVRTGLDAVLALCAGVIAVAAIPGLGDALGVDAGSLAKVAAITGAITVGATKVRNMLEDRGLIPAILKAPASPGADPLPDPSANDGVGLDGVSTAGDGSPYVGKHLAP